MQICKKKAVHSKESLSHIATLKSANQIRGLQLGTSHCLLLDFITDILFITNQSPEFSTLFPQQTLIGWAILWQLKVFNIQKILRNARILIYLCLWSHVKRTDFGGFSFLTFCQPSLFPRWKANTEAIHSNFFAPLRKDIEVTEDGCSKALGADLIRLRTPLLWKLARCLYSGWQSSAL